MGSFELAGAAASEGVNLPIIATSCGMLVGSGDSGDMFVSLLFEINPLKHHCDTRIVITTRPVEIVYDAVSSVRCMLASIIVSV